ncbi:trace amine-associated receptor 1-like [Megalops cyprinoides]|uniref:trace amine-associated receptor 1-like n=1 Tax=Megalops cyprinoides TaxID=118141 RepID=UPI00186424B5|nr:trace amine-associated receptor 1-like [Megalops cyprinoides]
MNFTNGTNFNSMSFTETQFCYESLSGSCEKLFRPLSIQFLMFLFTGMAVMATVSGNLLVITSIAHFKQLHTSTNYLILSLAVCDFFMGAFVMPCSAVRTVLGCWYLGDFMCKIHTSTDLMLSICSIFHLSFISIDRYFAVCNPLMYRSIISSVTILIMLTTSWVFPVIFAYALIFSKLYMKGFNDSVVAQVTCLGSCALVFNRESNTIITALSFFLPALILLCIYLKIYMVARRQARAIKQLTKQLDTEGTNEYRVSKQERKGAKTLSIVVGVFLMCWTPFFLCSIIDPFTGYSAPPLMYDALFWFGYLNSAFNPVVYAFFYSWFRKALKIIICGEIFYSNSCQMRLYME